jgi:hypothetical protein
MARPKRSSPKPRHVRQPARCCLIRIVRNGKQVGFVGTFDSDGRIIASGIAAFSGNPSHYWKWLRSAFLPTLSSPQRPSLAGSTLK